MNLDEPISCLRCAALVRRIDMPSHEAWHDGLMDALVEYSRARG